MPAGKVKWFNNAKGYGFILADGSEEDLFVHYSSIVMDGYKTLKAGQPVAFDTMQASKGIHAVNIRPCDSEEEAVQTALEIEQSQDEAPLNVESTETERQRRTGSG
ncbi:cold shock domain-containing protein [Natronospirillum sp.]|uniref:cold shock domain-containing protein n=1 Tax=Natronospirillum sp. TaxID=2812955 RepID=UPI0025D309F4|nr:cold shock domain-containing protein [Natronospirillum sp.]